MISVELTEKECQIIRAQIQGKLDLSFQNYEKDRFESDKQEMIEYNQLLDKLNLEPKVDTLINKKDFLAIKSIAMTEYDKLPIPAFITGIQVEQRDLVHVAVVKSVIMWLNKNNLIKNLVKFDFTDDSCDYEGIEG